MILKENNIRIAVIKHAHHDFDIDYPGKDSYRIRKAGAIETLVASKHRWALIHEAQNDTHSPNEEPQLFELIKQFKTSELDLILVEGFKHENFPRILLHRKGVTQSDALPHDSNAIALATDNPETKIDGISQLDINQPKQISHFILRFINENKRRLPQ